MSKYVYDEKGKWLVQGAFNILPVSELSEKERNRQLSERMKVTYTLPKVSREEELIALQTLEMEDLKDRIIKLKNGGV